MRKEYPPTIQAIWKNDLAALESLLGDPTRVNERDSDGRTPLMAAAIDSKLAAIKLLLSAHAEVDLQDPDGWSALHFAAQEKSCDVCAALLDAGARHDITNSRGATPLFVAVINYRGSGEIITLLRSRGADPLAANAKGISPCSLARGIANYDVAKFFTDVAWTKNA